MTVEISDTRIEEEKRALRGVRTQRICLAAGALLFIIGARIVFPAVDNAVHLGVIGAITLNALAFCLPRPARARIPMMGLPVASAFVFSACAVVVMANDPAPDAARFALTYGLLAPYFSLLAPIRRGATNALISLSVVAVAGALYLETMTVSFDLLPALAFLAVAAALSFSIAHMLERARRDAVLLRIELARRATSDDISGVSNRAHVSLLAQNEFSRARRYGEPYSCLMIEIENFEGIAASRGRAAANAIAQVFTGYCVVVMRHCDSFGRLTSGRFLALLPETPSVGAHTLAERMCRDLSALGVAFGGETLHFNVSIGCAQMHAVDRWAGDMLRRAEQGLADALERGGNCAVFATVPMSQPTVTCEDAADPDEATRR